MEFIKIVILCLILMTKCFAVENKTTDLAKQLRIQKREKQYLIDDDDKCEGPEQKRDERQSTPSKKEQVEPTFKPYPMNVRLQPKILSAPLKPAVLPKNFRIDNTPQGVPAKRPVTLKAGKVIPGPAHAVRLKMLENRRNDSVLNKEINTKEEFNLPPNNDNSSAKYKEDIPFTMEDKFALQTEDRVSPNKEDETVNKDGKEKLHKERKVLFDQDSKVPSNKNKHNVLSEDGKVPSNEEELISLPRDNKATSDKSKDDKVIAKPTVTVETNFIKENADDSLDSVRKPINFFIDEADSTPLSMKKQTKSENRSAKNKEVVPNKIKEISIAKKEKKKQKSVESEQKEQGTNNHSDNDPDIVHISNGTHIISIKKLHAGGRHKMQHLLTRDDTDETQPAGERIVNNPPPDKPENNPAGESEENVMLAVFGDNKLKGESIYKAEVKTPDAKEKQDKDQNECITITNHDYEECKETTKLPSQVSVQPTNSYNDGSQGSWNYLQTLPNMYCNPYPQNIYDQYKRYYDGAQRNSNLPSLDNNDPYAQNPENSQVYNPNENQANYNDPYEKKPELDYTYCPENTLDRIWRAWKDVEIKIRKSQTGVEPIDIDIRRNMVDSNVKVNHNKNGDAIGHVPIPYATPPIGLNGYYNNQNNGLIYPYANPSYRYVG